MFVFVSDGQTNDSKHNPNQRHQYAGPRAGWYGAY